MRKWIKRLLCKHRWSDPIADYKIHRMVSECVHCGKKKYTGFDIEN